MQRRRRLNAELYQDTGPLMPTRESMTWIFVHDKLPNHPKIRGLSDGAFRLLIETWCWCGEYLTDGQVGARLWATMGAAKYRKELIGAGLIDVLLDGDVAVHDWLDIQRSNAEIEETHARSSAGGTVGAHRRWHVNANTKDPACRLCHIPTPIRKGSASL